MWARARRRWKAWVESRSPRRDELRLTQRNVYIVPSSGGWVFAAVTLVLLLAAINEQLNLAYALAFLLGGVGMSAMSSTHGNLRGLTLTLGETTRAHAGQPLSVTVHLGTPGPRKGRYGLVWAARGLAGALPGTINCEVSLEQGGRVTLPVPTQARGWMELPTWRIETTYPLGLFRAWSYWRAASKVLVWPALEATPPPVPALPDAGATQDGNTRLGPDEPQDLRPWRRGDRLSTVVWRKSALRLAQGLEPVSMDTAAAPEPQVLWLDWAATGAQSTEARLSRLAAWLVAAEQAASAGGPPYGLRLPGLEREGQQGPAHLHRCLDDLALWGQITPNAATPTEGLAA